MECPYCGQNIDDRGYMSSGTGTVICPRCKSVLVKDENIKMHEQIEEMHEQIEEKEPKGPYASTVIAIIVALILLFAAIITPWSSLRDKWFSFKEDHPAMSEKIPSYADKAVEVDADAIYESLSSLFDFTDNTLNRMKYTETMEDKMALLSSIDSLYQTVDVGEYGRLYLTLTKEDPTDDIKTFNVALNEFMSFFEALKSAPSDETYINECRNKNDTVAAIFGITYENY